MLSATQLPGVQQHDPNGLAAMPSLRYVSHHDHVGLNPNTQLVGAHSGGFRRSGAKHPAQPPVM